MIEIGKTQTLFIVRKVSFGVYLGETGKAEERDTVLLPSAQVPENAGIGDAVDVFIYRDSEDRIIATTTKPLIEAGQIASLKVVSVTRVGAFLDMGLEKDLLLPFHEQTRKVKEGETVLAALYVDKSGRLAATMNVYRFLRTDSPYKAGDMVEGTVYETSEKFGVFVAVDNMYSGLVPRRDVFGKYEIGGHVTVRVSRVMEDGKLELTRKQEAYLQMNIDADSVLRVIREDYDGELPFDDKADPELIREIFGLSKAAFKRAVGKLYKERSVDIRDGKIIEAKGGRSEK